MTIINPKSIAGVTSITTASGADNLLTVHTNNTTERIRINNDGDVIVGSGITVSPDGDIFTTGVTTATTFVGALTGNVTGNINGDLTGTLQTGAQTNITSLGTLTSATISGDLTIADSIVHSGDTDTKIRFPSANQFTVETAGTERLKLDRSSDQSHLYVIGDDSGLGARLFLQNKNTTSGALSSVECLDNGGQSVSGIKFHITDHSNNEGFISMFTRPSGGTTTERVRITSDGTIYPIGSGQSFNSSILPNGSNVQINTTSSSHGFSVTRYSANYGGYALNIGRSRSDTIGSNVLVNDGNDLGHITWYGADGTDFNQAAAITAQVDGSPSGGDDMPGRLVFKTTPDGSGTVTERMRITSGGSLLIGRTTATSFGNLLQTKSIDVVTDGDTTGMFFDRTDSNAAWVAMRFHVQASQKGYIQVNTGSVTYSTSSDYRLKENVVSISDGITRLKQLKPYRFNFKNDSSTTLDGFYAHEASEVVPESVVGTKDAVDSEGNIDPQGIDQSKLVPLLTAALQEAVTKIEVLETRLNNAGIAT